MMICCPYCNTEGPYLDDCCPGSRAETATVKQLQEAYTWAASQLIEEYKNKLNVLVKQKLGEGDSSVNTTTNTEAPKQLDFTFDKEMGEF